MGCQVRDAAVACRGERQHAFARVQADVLAVQLRELVGRLGVPGVGCDEQVGELISDGVELGVGRVRPRQAGLFDPGRAGQLSASRTKGLLSRIPTGPRAAAHHDAGALPRGARSRARSSGRQPRKVRVDAERRRVGGPGADREPRLGCRGNGDSGPVGMSLTSKSKSFWSSSGSNRTQRVAVPALAHHVVGVPARREVRGEPDPGPRGDAVRAQYAERQKGVVAATAGHLLCGRARPVQRGTHLGGVQDRGQPAAVRVGLLYSVSSGPPAR